MEMEQTCFQPLTPLLTAQRPEKIAAVRSKLETMDRDDLIILSRSSFAAGKRVAFHLSNDELTRRGIPPVFRHHLDRLDKNRTREEMFDLLLADVRWLRREYPDHAKPSRVRYKRSRDMLSFAEPLHLRETEFAFYGGRRPAWKIVGRLSLTNEQQRDCVWLCTAPIKKLIAAIQTEREGVFKALQDDLQRVRRTTTFTEGDAHETLKRRHALWLCSRMVTDESPTAIARRYMQLTGETITRQAVAKQLKKVVQALPKTR
jgi:hypothetical protein